MFVFLTDCFPRRMATDVLFLNSLIGGELEGCVMFVLDAVLQSSNSITNCKIILPPIGDCFGGV